MNIYSANGELVLSVTPSGSSQRTRKIMGDNSLSLVFESTDFIEIPLYSYIDYEGERYTLWRPEDFTKNGDRIWEYAVKFGGWQEFLKTRMFKFLSAVPHELKFPITAKPDALVQILVDNLNENGSGWTKGEVIDATEKTLSFNYEYCYDALNRIAEEFSTEWEIQGKTIHLRKVEKYKTNPVPLKYGKDNGLRPGIMRKVKKEKAPVTKLYVQGGERNINRSAYGSKSLLLPTDRTLQYEGRTYRTDPSGMFITRADRTLTVYNEDGFDATHIYPSRVGTVSEVITVDDEQNFYDFKDSSIPEDLNFSDCRIPGEKATVIFQTGVLAGKEFDIEQTDDDLTGYVHAERRFKLVPLDEDGTVYPNENCQPHVGDRYAVFNISLPQAYVRDDATQTGASWDMFREAVKYMYENEDELFTITGELSSLFAKENWLDIGGRIVPGGYIAFSDDRFMQEATLIRITGIAEPLEQPWKATLELSNVSIAGNILTGLSKLEAEEVVIESKTKELRRYMSRSWRDAIETLHMVENSLLENFTGAINPIAIQSMAILVGDKNLQFRFVNSKTNPQRVEHVVTFNNTTKILYAPAGIIQHQTLGISDVSSAHKASEYKYWDIPAYTSPPLDDAKAYYLYAKVSATNQTGTFVLSETAKAMNADAGYYYLWVGQINSAYDGVRTDFLTMYGFTEITPGQITTDVLRDPDAKLVIDLANARITAQNGAEIVGKITFSDGSSGLDNLQEWPSFMEQLNLDLTDIENSVTNLDNYVNEAFYDGVITESEARGIKEHIEIVQEEVNSLYTELYNNSFLSGTPKTDLATAKTNFDSAFTALSNVITAAISDGFATDKEKADVSAAFATFKTKLNAFYTAAQNAQEAIDCYLATKTVKLYQQEMAGKKKEVDATYNEVYNDPKLTNTTANGNAKTALQTAYNNFNTAHTALASAITAALNDNIVYASELSDVEGKYETFCTRAGEFTTAATKAQKEIVNASVENLEDYVNEAFYDGVISESEARGIKEHIEIVQEEVNSLYTELYNNSFLSGTPKTNLATAKTNFNSALTALSNAINSAIIDGFATDAEKVAVNNAFATFKTKVNEFYTAAQNAQEAIDCYLATKTVKLYQQEMAGKKKEVDATYNEVYNDPKLANTTANGNAKTALQTAYNNFNTAHTALANAITAALNDNIVNASELSDVEGKYETFCTQAGEFTTAATKAQKEIVNTSVENLEDYVNDAFYDGVITESEAIGIKKHIEVVQEEVNSLYTQLYNNSYLSGTAKTNLYTAKNNFNSALTALSNAITSAISDGFATDAEKTAVNNAFATFKTKVNEFYTAAQNAQAAIDCYLATKTVKLYQQEMAGKKKEVDATYNEVYNDPKLANTTANGNAKTVLQTAYNNFNTAHTALANAITAALNDNIVNASELSDVEGKYETFCTRAGEFTTAATKAQKEIVNASVENLEDYVNDAFYDGVITESEAIGIKKHIEVVQEEVNSLYTQLYNNSYLSGTAKTNLYTAKNNFNSALTALSNAITSAISDGFATDAEKTAVNNAFATFKTKVNEFYTAAQNAQAAIDNYIAGLATTAQSTADKKPKVFYGTTAPSSSSGRETGDLWVDGTHIYRFNGSSWVVQAQFDVTQTVINGGLITTGAITFGTTGGMTASGTIRIWAGGSNSTPSGATFRVYSDGRVFARNSVRVEDPNETVVCGLSSDGTNTGTVNDLSYPGSIRIWAGGSDPTTANFRVSHAGTVNAKFFVTKGISGYMDQYGFNFRDGTNDKNYGYLTTSGGTTFQVSATTLPLQLVCAGSVSQVALKMINTAGNNAQFMLGYLQHGSEYFGRPYIKMTNPLWTHYSEFSGHTFRNVVWDEDTGYFLVVV